MGPTLYEPEEIQRASGKVIDTADPDTSFFLGPTSESDLVFAFPNKLEALYFLKSYFENQLSKIEKIKINSQIKSIHKDLSDTGTQAISEILENNESLEIYAEGYWDDFVPASHPFWGDWTINSGDIFPKSQFWTNDDDLDSIDDMSAAEDIGGQSLIFSEPPEDVFNPEFVEALLKIIPLA
jgi:hypothetical protein